jgi:hypothetical protein
MSLFNFHFMPFARSPSTLHLLVHTKKLFFLLSPKRLLNGQLLAGKIHLIGLGGLSLTHSLTD